MHLPLVVQRFVRNNLLKYESETFHSSWCYRQMNHLFVSVTAAATLRDIFVTLPSFSEAVNNTYMTVLNTAVYREALTHTLSSAKRILSHSVSLQRLFSCSYMNKMYVWWAQTLSEGKNVSGWDKKVRLTLSSIWSCNPSWVLLLDKYYSSLP